MSFMWGKVSRRKDIVVQQRLARSCATWLVNHEEQWGDLVDPTTKEKLKRYGSRSAEKSNELECWAMLSKSVVSIVEQGVWHRIRQRFYQYRRITSQAKRGNRIKTIQLPQSIYDELLMMKSDNECTFAEVIDDLIAFRKEREMED